MTRLRFAVPARIAHPHGILLVVQQGGGCRRRASDGHFANRRLTHPPVPGRSRGDSLVSSILQASASEPLRDSTFQILAEPSNSIKPPEQRQDFHLGLSAPISLRAPDSRTLPYTHFMPPLLPMADASFPNPIWSALRSTQKHLTIHHGRAQRFPADVAPLASLDEDTPEAISDLRTLLAPGETIYLAGSSPPCGDSLLYRGATPCLRMVFPQDASLPARNLTLSIRALTCADAPAMVALTNVAFPGFFRSRTCVMGAYFGLWNPAQPGALIAMAGERLCFQLDHNKHPYHEISGVCTHPDHLGQGYAAALVTHLLHHQRSLGAHSFLHVVSSNVRAIQIYQRLGFQTLQEVQLQRLKRPA